MASGRAPRERRTDHRSTRQAHRQALDRWRLALCAADVDHAPVIARVEHWIVEVEGRIAALEGRPPTDAGCRPR
jgi:hypothetical protein